MMAASELNTLQYDSELCIGCGMCSIVCPHAVFAQNNHVARLVYPDACMECGACSRNCPVEAIEVRAGVGCAAAILSGFFSGKEGCCDCSGEPDKPCC